MGSILFLASWAVLMGPIQYAQHLISGPRLPFTAVYLGSITFTLVSAIKVSLTMILLSTLAAVSPDPGVWHPCFPCRPSQRSEQIC